MKEEHLYFGVVKFPLRLIKLDGIELAEDCADEADDQAVAFPPLLIQYEEGKFYYIEQKEILAALKQRKVNAYPTVIVLKKTTDYKRIIKHYGNVLFFIDHA
ncbi:MAG: hypothetical protein ACQEXQ_21905 [Bacillota bacterium]